MERVDLNLYVKSIQLNSLLDPIQQPSERADQLLDLLEGILGEHEPCNPRKS